MADIDLVRRLVTEDRGLAVVTTLRTDGSAQASVVNAGVLADPLDGHEVTGAKQSSAGRSRPERERERPDVTGAKQSSAGRSRPERERERPDVIAFVARGGSVKLRNLRRDPRATVVFRAGWQWVAVEGTATIVGPDDPGAGFDAGSLPSLLRDVFRAAGGTHDDWEEYDRVMATERRAAVLVTPTRIYGTG